MAASVMAIAAPEERKVFVFKLQPTLWITLLSRQDRSIYTLSFFLSLFLSLPY